MTEQTYRGAEFSEPRHPSEYPLLRHRIQRRLRNCRRFVFGMFFRVCYHVVPRLPVWVMRALGRVVIVPISSLLHRRVAEANLVKVYGDELTAAERKRILAGVFRGLHSFLIECVGVMKHGEKYFADCIEDTSARRLIADLEARSSKGWIGVTPHLGNWVMLGSWATSLPGDRGRCHAIAKRQPNPHLSSVVDEIQDRMGLVPIYTDASPVKVVTECLKVLRRGGRLGIAPDQDTAKVPGVFIDFLGHPAYTPTGPAQLALTVGVPLVPLALVRRDGGGGQRFEVIHGEPIYPNQEFTGTRAEEMLRLTNAWSVAIEAMIHAHKDHWAWFHERWDTTPEKLEAKGRALPE